MGEVGELADLFQFKGDCHVQQEHAVVPQDKMSMNGSDDSDDDVVDTTIVPSTTRGLESEGWNVEKIDKVHQEIADVAIYCLELTDVLGIQERVSLE